MTKHHIVYIPGLGDGTLNLASQKAAMLLWRARYGVSTQVVRVKWADSHESFDDKVQRVLHAIDTANARGYSVSIVAASAGASIATIAYAQRATHIHRVVTIVGAHGPVTDASPATLKANPALEVSLMRQPAAIQALTPANRGRMLSVKPLADNIVPLKDMNIPGIHYLQLSTRGHLVTIAAALTIHSHKLVAFIKRSI